MINNLAKKLAVLHNEEIISDIDLQLYKFFSDFAAGEDAVLLASVLASYFYRQGDVCIRLDKLAGQPLFTNAEEDVSLQAPSFEEWVAALEKSSVVGGPDTFRPLIWDGKKRLYLQKLWYYEDRLFRQILEKSSIDEAAIDYKLLTLGLQQLFPKSEQPVDWQKIAAITAVRSQFSVISGGPGTGKTSTVVRILALLAQQAVKNQQHLSIALAAPTGKAAARLQQSILQARESIPISEEALKIIPVKAKTIHQLLGASRHSAKLKYHAENPLPVDVLIVDEASMIDQALMSKLMDALLAKTKVILLGDKDQLASVEAGAVLGNICGKATNTISDELADYLTEIGLEVPDEIVSESPQKLTDNITLLTKNYRFKDESGIAELAAVVNTGNHSEAQEILTKNRFSDISLSIPEHFETIEEKSVTSVSRFLKSASQRGSVDSMFSEFATEQILCAHRKGPYGVAHLNARIEHILKRKGTIPANKTWYPGRPVIINQNNYGLGLYNGDIGICLVDKSNRPEVVFQREDTLVRYAPSRLNNFDLAYALTIHKSQGSEFDSIMLILPDQPSQLITRELLYTAITRARQRVEIVGSAKTFEQGVKKRVERTSGLQDRLWS